ncbi:MAG: 3-methyl-2-oxobutanoate hydroxymethyltransferase [Gammaproteobacteria bacterium]
MSSHSSPAAPADGARKPVTIASLGRMKASGEKFSVLTAYDASFAALVSRCGVDVILVGDSLGMVLQGHDSTLPVSIDDMCYHVACVKRGNPHSLIMADLPFMGAASVERALDWSGKLMAAGAHMVKIEGGGWLSHTIIALKRCGIPVCAHLGLTPQSVNAYGGYKVQGRDDAQAETIIADAKALVAAGADVLLFECIPRPLAKRIMAAVHVPVIGIGAAPECDGQVLVLHDILGVSPGKPARFVKNFLAGRSDGIEGAVRAYVAAVKDGSFPADEHCF